MIWNVLRIIGSVLFLAALLIVLTFFVYGVLDEVEQPPPEIRQSKRPRGGEP